MTDTAWRRLHPLSPLVRGGRLTIGIAILLAPDLLFGRDPSHDFVQIGIAGGFVLLGFVSWLVTRWRVDDDDLRIETGLLRRRSLRFPLSQVQAIDIVRPGLARMLRLAELRLRMGGLSGATARLAYLHKREADALRDRLLALAGGVASRDEVPIVDRVEERVLTVVPTDRLVASILISDVGLAAEAVLAGPVVVAVLSPAAAVGVVTGGGAAILSVATLVWRRFNQEFRLTVAESAAGLRLHSGLVALTAETIRPGRVQGVRMVEPVLWRPLGWCRLEVDLAGGQRSKRGGPIATRQASGGAPRRQSRGRGAVARPDRSRPAGAPVAAAPACCVEEPAALPEARLGPNRHVRGHEERSPAASELLGAARKGAEHPLGPGAGAAPSPSRDRACRHRGTQPRRRDPRPRYLGGRPRAGRALRPGAGGQEQGYAALRAVVIGADPGSVAAARRGESRSGRDRA